MEPEPEEDPSYELNSVTVHQGADTVDTYINDKFPFDDSKINEDPMSQAFGEVLRL